MPRFTYQYDHFTLLYDLSRTFGFSEDSIQKTNWYTMSKSGLDKVPLKFKLNYELPDRSPSYVVFTSIDFERYSGFLLMTNFNY